MFCWPSRPAGTTIHVHVSITGYGNFSDDFVEVTYYNDVTLGNDRNTQTMVSAVAPLYGPVAAPSVVLARGTNFAPAPVLTSPRLAPGRLTCRRRCPASSAA